MLISLSQYKELIQSICIPELEYYLIPFASPILYFGNIKDATVATLGINPSNKEFLDNNNKLILGELRRFHTLNSLHLSNWEELDNDMYIKIIESFENYFVKNPYDSWFKQLDYLLSGAIYSYYFPYNNLVHLDLTPITTNEKWGKIPIQTQKILLEKGVAILCELINNSSIKTLVLNGQSVVKSMELLTDSIFLSEYMPSWNLPRKDKDIRGYSYEFEIRKIANIPLNRTIKILGYNHNIQSSYGVTNAVKTNIRNWLKEKML